MNENLPEHLVDATLIFDEIPDYHGFVQVFAGTGAPTIDRSFKTINQGTIRITTSLMSCILINPMFHYQYHFMIPAITE